MKKLLIPLCAAALLGACSHNPDNSFASGRIVPQAVAYQGGFGVVDRVVTSPSLAAAAGGTADMRAAGASGLNRVYVRMDDGRIQFVDTASNELQRGMRVELLPDRTIKIQP